MASPEAGDPLVVQGKERIMSVASASKVHGYCGLCIARCGASRRSRTAASSGSIPIPRTRPARRCAPRDAPRRSWSTPGRLTHPLRRTRPKGDADPGWERIGWDEALDLTAAAMRRIAEQHGPEAVAFSHVLALDDRDRRFRGVHPAADERLRHARTGWTARYLRLGPRASPPATPSASAASAPAAPAARCRTSPTAAA